MNRSGKLAAILVASIWLSAIGGIVSLGLGQEDDVTTLDLNTVIRRADVVLVGKLDSIPIPYEVLGKDFYAIKPDSVLNGFVGEGSVLVIEWNKASWEGSPALVQPSFSYMLFLRRIDLHSEGLPKELTAYCLVRNWKGIISLSKNASERRAVRHIQRNYGIWVDDVVQEFVEAVRFSVSNYANDEDLKEVQLSKGATKIYNALKLKQRQQENAEKGESPHP